MASKESLILESATEQFFKFGFKKTNIDDIAKHAGVGKGTVYNYFQNKEELFFRCADSQQERLNRQYDTEIKQYKGIYDPLINHVIVRHLLIKKMVTQYSISMETMQELAGIFIKSQKDLDRHIGEFRELLEEGEKAGRYKSGDHQKTAEILFDINFRFLFKWLEISQEEVVQDIAQIYGMLLTGLLK